MKHSLLPRISLDQRNLLLAAPGELQIFQSLFINRKNPASCSIFGGHICYGGAVGQGEIAEAGAEVFDELSDYAVLAEHSVMVRTKSVAVAPSRRRPVNFTPTTNGINIETGWPSIAASASIPPTPHPRTPNPLIIVVWLSVPTSVSGRRHVCPGFVDEDYAGEIFEIDLMHDAGVGRDDGEIAEAGLSPAEKRVALFVALKFEQRVHFESVGGAEFVDLHGVVDHEFDGLKRIDQRGISAELLHGVAHGGEIDDAGNAGEVLEQDAARSEGDFFFRLGVLVPGGERGDFFFGDVASVFGAQQVLEQDAQRKGQVLGRDALLIERVEAVDFVFLGADFEGGAGIETVRRT